MPKSRSGLLVSTKDVTILDVKPLVRKINKNWSDICVKAAKLRAVPDAERDFLFWSECGCWRSTVWRFQDNIRFCRDAGLIDVAKCLAIQKQVEELIRDVERGDLDV